MQVHVYVFCTFMVFMATDDDYYMGAFQVDCPTMMQVAICMYMDTYFHRPDQAENRSKSSSSNDRSLNFPPNKCSLASSRKTTPTMTDPNQPVHSSTHSSTRTIDISYGKLSATIQTRDYFITTGNSFISSTFLVLSNSSD